MSSGTSDRATSGLALAEKSVAVTGASRGIGAACAVACAEAGAAEVALVARSEEDLAAVAADVRAAGARVNVCAADLTDRQGMRQAFTSVGALDILISCAGANQPEAFVDIEPETFDRLWKLNVGATFFAAQMAARRMIADGTPGVILNVSSQMGHVGAPLRSVYCATKHAVEGLTKALAVELAEHRIRVLAVAPTFVRTAMTAAQLDAPDIREPLLEQIPMRRFATVDDVAAAIVFGASDAAGMVTGTSLLVDGGWTAK